MKYNIQYAKTTLVVRILLGLFMLGTGGMGLFMILSGAEIPLQGSPELVSFMTAILATGWLFTWISLFKTVTGILLFIPKTAPLATLMALPFFVNILLYTIFTAPEYLIMGLVVLLLNVWLVYGYSERYKPILE